MTLLRHAPAAGLLALSVWLAVAFLRALLTDGAVQNDLMVALLLLAGAWWLYTLLPPGMRQAARWGWRTGQRLLRRR